MSKDDAPVNYSAYLGTGREPEWQCQIPESFYGGFDGMPWHCVFSDMLRKGLEGEQLWHEEKKQENPIYVNILIKKSLPVRSDSDKMMSYSLGSTTKRIDDEEGDDDDEPIKIYTFTHKFEERFTAEYGGNDDPNEEQINAALRNLVGNDWGPDGGDFEFFLQGMLEISVNAKIFLNELLHCNNNEKIQENLKTIARLRNNVVNNRNATSTEKRIEFGFLVLRRGGYIVVTNVITSNQEFRSLFGQYNPDEILALFHTHPFDGFPSPSDVKNATINNWIVYVYGTQGLALFNPQNPKDAKGKDRFIKAAECPD